MRHCRHSQEVLSRVSNVIQRSLGLESYNVNAIDFNCDIEVRSRAETVIVCSDNAMPELVIFRFQMDLNISCDASEVNAAAEVERLLRQLNRLLLISLRKR